MDLLFYGGGIGFNAYFRALHGVTWINKGLINTEEILYSELRDAKYEAKKHPNTGYYDLFYDHPSNSPPKGYTYFIKTTDGNLSIVKISNYLTTTFQGNNFSREMKIWFKTFPNVEHPPKPEMPVK